jgi:hypothetical protein
MVKYVLDRIWNRKTPVCNLHIGRKWNVLKLAVWLREQGIILYYFSDREPSSSTLLPELTLANGFLACSNSNHNIKKIAETIN